MSARPSLGSTTPLGLPPRASSCSSPAAHTDALLTRSVQLAAEAAPDATPAQVALAWVAAQPGVTTVIPGARNPEQAHANAAAGSITLPSGFTKAVSDLYDRRFRAAVHPRW